MGPPDFQSSKWGVGQELRVEPRSHPLQSEIVLRRALLPTKEISPTSVTAQLQDAVSNFKGLAAGQSNQGRAGWKSRHRPRLRLPHLRHHRVPERVYYYFQFSAFLERLRLTTVHG